MIMYYCLAIAMLLPITLALGSLPFRFKQFSTPDLNEPRAQAEQLSGAGARMVAAQKNAWEALILFTVSLFIAYANNIGGEQISLACIIFIIARICHAFLYVIGWGVLRFLSFMVAAAAVMSIVYTAIF